MCKVTESQQVAEDTLEMYAMKDKSLGMKSKYKHEAHIIKRCRTAHRGAVTFLIGNSPSTTGGSRILKFNSHVFKLPVQK
jgi:hypothetical protein